MLLFCKDSVSLARIAFGVIANKCSFAGPLQVVYLDHETVQLYLNGAAFLVYVILMLAFCMALLVARPPKSFKFAVLSHSKSTN